MDSQDECERFRSGSGRSALPGVWGSLQNGRALFIYISTTPTAAPVVDPPISLSAPLGRPALALPAPYPPAHTFIPPALLDEFLIEIHALLLKKRSVSMSQVLTTTVFNQQVPTDEIRQARTMCNAIVPGDMATWGKFGSSEEIAQLFERRRRTAVRASSGGR